MTRPRKDYGCPLRIYAGWSTVPVYHALPPRSARTAANYAMGRGHWAAWRMAVWPAGLATYAVHVAAGPHLGQRIHWQALPSAVQAAVRASFLGEYCPKEGA